MDLSLSPYRALVCGSTQGIGEAAAVELAALGATVTLLARNEAALRRVAEALPRPHGQAHTFLVADFSDPAALRETVSHWLATLGDPVHILVNNTGGPPGGPLIEAQPEAFLRAYDMHLLCNHHLVQLLRPGMARAGYGRIINVISTSVKQPIPGLGVSNTTRGAVASWAKTLAGELGPEGITVNNILPGFTETERLFSIIRDRATKTDKSEAEVAEAFKQTAPARRFGRPEEVAAAIAFLASPAAAYINGINLPVDGGRTSSL